jgi:hypothetical protein
MNGLTEFKIGASVLGALGALATAAKWIRRVSKMPGMQAIRDKFLLIATTAIENEVDGREITRKLDAELDKELGPGVSEKLQEGPVANLLFEMVEGLYEDNPAKLLERIEAWKKTLTAK